MSNIIFSERYEAEMVLNYLSSCIKTVKRVSLSVLYDICGIVNENEQENDSIGWTESDSFRIERLGEHDWVINFAQPKPIEPINLHDILLGHSWALRYHNTH